MLIEEIPEQVEKLIEKGEGIDTEFKTSLAELNRDTFESICAFLNTGGGHLFLGIKNDGGIEGVIEDCLKDIVNNIITNANNPKKLNPPYYLQPRIFKTGNEHIIYVFIPESSQVHSTVGKIYLRNEDGDFDITGNHGEVSNLYFRKKNNFSENTIYPYLQISDFSTRLFDRVRSLVQNRRPDHPWLEMNNEELLNSASLFRKDFQTGDEGYTLAAALIFGKDEVIHSVLPDFKTDAVVRIIDTNRYDERDLIRTNLIDGFDRLMTFTRKNIPDTFFTEKGQRISLRDHIFREVIVNMLIHREYMNPYPAKFIIEKERVYTENWNRPHGKGNIDPDSFSPYPKNPVIAKFFNEIGWAEELGSGIRNTFRYCEPYVEGRQPEFIEEDVFKSIIPIPFRSSIIGTDDGPKGVEEGALEGAVKGALEGAVKGALEGAVKGALEGAVKGATGGVVEKLTRLTLVIIEMPGNRVPYYADRISIPEKTIEGYVRRLREASVIEFSEGDALQIGGYYITEEFKKKINK